MSENQTNNAKDKKTHPPIIKKVIKKGGGHHGGSWKIAYADFVTAMMAFFLLMWLIASLNKAQKEGIAEYFRQPLKVTFFGGDNVGNQQIRVKGGGPNMKDTNGQVSTTDKASTTEAEQKDRKIIQSTQKENQKLEELKSQISLSIKTDPSLSGLKDQLLMEVTNEGLRIQLIDNQKQPMFNVGEEKLNPQFELVFTKIAKLLNGVPNKVSIQGHTDAHPYHNPDELDYTNWELSTQRANAARRALIKSGLDENKVMTVSGFSSTVLLDKKNPFDPINRRISIIVMKPKSVKTLKEQGIKETRQPKTDVKKDGAKPPKAEEAKKVEVKQPKAEDAKKVDAASPKTQNAKH